VAASDLELMALPVVAWWREEVGREDEEGAATFSRGGFYFLPHFTLLLYLLPFFTWSFIICPYLLWNLTIYPFMSIENLFIFF
jgi:hypothetical protein